MKKNSKTIFRDFIVSNNPFYKPKEGKRILCFHDIQNALEFENRIKWLLKKFEIVSIETLLSSNKKNLLAISFDDGYESWLINVAPVLIKHKLPATFFVNSGLVGLTGNDMEHFFIHNCKRNPEGLKALSHASLSKLASNPLFDIGGHTKDHFLFSKHTSLEIIKTQISKDKLLLETLTHQNLKYFAYPFGQVIHAPEQVRLVLKEVGYQHAFTIVPGFITTNTPSYLLHRDSLELFQSDRLWNKWLQGSYDSLVSFKNYIFKTLFIPYR